MGEAKTYRLARNVRAFYVFVVLFFIGVGSYGLIDSVRRGEPGLILLVGLWLAAVVATALRQAFQGILSITLEDDTVTFRSPLRTTALPVSSLISVEVAWWDTNRIRPFFRHSDGKMRLIGPFDGFYELLTELKKRNPAIEIKRL